MDLRPYQTAAIEAARAQIANEQKSRVLIILPTGGGKTVVASEIIRGAEAKGSRVLFLAHRRELIKQTCDKLHRFGVRHGVIMAGFPPALQHAVQVASVQTLIRRPGQLPKVDLIFIDEAHHATKENTYAKLLEWYPHAVTVGLTATPWRLDGNGLADVFDGHVIGSTPRQLRDDGWLVPVGGWEYESIDTSGARVQNGDFVAKELQAAATSKRVVGDVIGEWQAHANNARTVLFAVTVEHSMLMAAEFCKAGVPAEHVDGETPAPERDAILARLKSGETRVVTNCNVLTEGWDCPEAEVCILARPTLSTSLALQMIGRVLRPAPGKERARIHDHAGVLAAHGHPYAERDYNPQLTVRGDRKKAEGSTAADRRCKSCNSVIARWPCDGCGYHPTPRELQLEYDEAARRKEIQNDGPPPPKPSDSAKVPFPLLTLYEKELLWARFVFKFGGRRALAMYRKESGETEWPRRTWPGREWLAYAREAGEYLARLNQAAHAARRTG